MGRYAYLHLCVSHAMSDFLAQDFKLQGDIIVLHDKAPLHFKSLQKREREQVRGGKI